MPVDAIVRDVGDAVLVPFDRHAMQVERGVLDLAVRLEPIDALADLAPEPVGVLDRARVHLAIFRLVDEGAALPVGRDLVKLVRHDLLLGDGWPAAAGGTFRHYAASPRAPTRRARCHFGRGGGP